jgi:Ca-activated chloride channel family protein
MNNEPYLRFANASALHLLWLVPLAAGLYALAFSRKGVALRAFAGAADIATLLPFVPWRRQVWKAAGMVAGSACLILALGRPQIGGKVEAVKERGIDLMIAIDCSRSMGCEDAKPSRMEAAKRETKGLIERLRGDRVGIVAFAGVAFVQCPPTLDYTAAQLFVDGLEPNLIPVQGTAIGEAIRAALRVFDPKEHGHKVLVIISDGEDHEEDPVDAAKEAARQGVVIHAIGVGSKTGEPVPVYDEAGNKRGFKRDAEGHIVLSKLDDVDLKRIASAGGGEYFRATSGGRELDRLYDDMQHMEKKEFARRRFERYREAYQWPLLVGLLLLLMDVLVADRGGTSEVYARPRAKDDSLQPFVFGEDTREEDAP